MSDSILWMISLIWILQFTHLEDHHAAMEASMHMSYTSNWPHWWITSMVVVASLYVNSLVRRVSWSHSSNLLEISNTTAKWEILSITSSQLRQTIDEYIHHGTTRFSFKNHQNWILFMTLKFLPYKFEWEIHLTGKISKNLFKSILCTVCNQTIAYIKITHFNQYVVWFSCPLKHFCLVLPLEWTKETYREQTRTSSISLTTNSKCMSPE